MPWHRSAIRNSRLGRTQPASQPQGEGVGKDDKDDRYFLRFPIQYPDYVPALAERGFERILRTDWAKAFWEKLVNTQPGKTTSLLNDQEKSFYYRCREELRANVLSGRELLREWDHICSKISSGQRIMGEKQLTEAIRQAQQSGDTKRALELLALKESRRRDDEQY